MLKFIVSSVLSGLVWDITKGTTKWLCCSFIRLSDDELKDIVNLAENIPQNEILNKSELRRYLRKNQNYQIIVERVTKNLTKFHVGIFIVIIITGLGALVIHGGLFGA